MMLGVPSFGYVVGRCSMIDFHAQISMQIIYCRCKQVCSGKFTCKITHTYKHLELNQTKRIFLYKRARVYLGYFSYLFTQN